MEELKIKKITDTDMNLDVEGQGCKGCAEVVNTRAGKPTGYTCEEVAYTGWVWGDAF